MTFLDKLPRPFLVLAPMDDVTDTVFRQMIADLVPPDLYFTEFVNVEGLQSPGRGKLLPKLHFGEKERPIIAQIWGIKPENFYKTTREIIEMGFDGVDLNFGCPIKKIVKGGACAAMINNRELAGEIIDATREAARSTSSGQAGHFPVSVKTRVGFNTTDLGWLEFLLSKKLDLLSIHGRTARQLSNVPANWEHIGKAREMRDVLCPTTLIIGNGDVYSRQQAEELASRYKLDGVMVGRGVFHDPFIFAKESPWGSYTKGQKMELFKKHIELFAKIWQHGEYRFDALKKFCKVYINGFDGASELRAKFMTAKNPEKGINIIDER